MGTLILKVTDSTRQVSMCPMRGSVFRAPVREFLSIWVFTVLLVFTAPAAADVDAATAASAGSIEHSTPQAFSQHIVVSFRKAPVHVVYKAVLADSGFDAVIDPNVVALVSGDYAGSISDVIQEISHQLSLNVEINDSLVHLDAAMPENAVGGIADPLTSIVSKSSSVASATRPLVRRLPTADLIVERLFVLEHAYAVDTRLGDSENTVIPGVVSQLKKIVDGLGLKDLKPERQTTSHSPQMQASVTALPSMNAVVVKDRESHMALYQDLISSIDLAFAASGRAQSVKNAATRDRFWTQVR